MPGRRSAARKGGGKGVELFTLGGVRLLRQGIDETAKLGAKHIALLVFLFQEQRPMHPSEVIEVLGRGQDDEKEMEGLRRAVTWLRDNVAGVDIRLVSETIEAMSGVRLDTRDVDAAIDDGDAACVMELYVGEFLEGFESGSPTFDEWAQKERGRVKRAWNHAMISAARQAERQNTWESAAEWWKILVARAPMRPEAVAGLLNALARSGREEEAARAYADYVARLKQTGVAQPADAVKQAVAQHKVLKQIADGQITPSAPLTPPPAAQPAPAQPPPPPPPPPPPEPSVASPMPTPPGPAVPDVSSGTETIAGFESGAAPLMREDTSSAGSAPPPPVGEAAALGTHGETEVPDFLDAGASGEEGEWDELVDLTAPDDFDIAVGPGPLKPETAPAAAPGPPAPGGTGRKASRFEDDEALRQAHEAAAAFVDTEYGAVRHEITSIRKPWAPFVKKVWDELEPWRKHLKELTVAGLRSLGQALAALPPLLGRLFGAMGRGASGAVASTKSSLKRRPRARKQKLEFVEVEAVELPGPTLEEAVPAEPMIEEIAPPEPVIEEVAPPEPVIEEVEPRAAGFDEALPEEFGAPAPAIEEPPAPALEEPPAPELDSWETERPAARAARAKPKRKLTLPRLGVLPMLRRYWYVPLALGTVGLAIVFGPGVVRSVGGFSRSLPDRIPDVQAPSLPKVTIPTVTIRTPSIVETSVSKIGELLSGPLLKESGSWVLVADAEIDETAPGAMTAEALGLTLESDLRQARFFSVVPRERALIARRQTTGSTSLSLPLEDALALARTEGYAIVLAARVRHVAGDDSVAPVDSVVLRALSPAGDTLYGVAAQVTAESDVVETLTGLTRAVRRRMGEPGKEIEASLAPSRFLSDSPEALVAYQQARMHLFAGRYARAVRAAQEASELDPGFALAYHLMAQANALRGQRRAARSALEIAWQLSDGTAERERLRILGDWLAWEGRLSDAAVTYDQLFSMYRDDVGALKSQGILQRRIGVRGAGAGNLRVAYMIDKYDWPPLSRIARYLGYDGRLPDVDSLIASIDATR